MKTREIPVCPNDILLYEGDDSGIYAKSHSINEDFGGIRWCSSDCSVIRVDPYTGDILAVGAGVAEIWGSTVFGERITEICSVTVLRHTVYVESIRFSPYSVDLKVGDVTTLTPSIFPENTSYPEVTWHSTNACVATVTAGTVYAKENGETTIVAAAMDDSEVCGYCCVTVHDGDIETLAGGA